LLLPKYAKSLTTYDSVLDPPLGQMIWHSVEDALGARRRPVTCRVLSRSSAMAPRGNEERF